MKKYVTLTDKRFEAKTDLQRLKKAVEYALSQGVKSISLPKKKGSNLPWVFNGKVEIPKDVTIFLLDCNVVCYKDTFQTENSRQSAKIVALSNAKITIKEDFKMKLGVITDCFKKGVKEGMETASKLGLKGVQVYATGGEFSPEVLTEKDIAEYNAFLNEKGLVVSALCGDMGGHGFEIEEDNAERVEKTKAIVDLAVKFGTKVTTHIGVIPDDENHPRFKTMLKALTACGEYAKSKGVTLAIETGPETAPTLYKFVSKTNGGVGVNLDPANFVMVTGQNPAEAVYLLKDYIVHTHLKDGKMLKKTDPKIIYDHFAEGGIEALNVADFFIETPIGEGDVNWSDYIKALNDIGFDGFLTIERETGADPEKDIIAGMDFIKKYL